MNIIDIKNLYFSYNGQRLLDDVSLSVNSGQFVRLSGPNGSGKSTLIKLLIKELSLQSGSIQLFGQSINKFNAFEKIGYLPQNSQNQNFPATVLEVMLTGLYPISKFRFASKKNRLAAIEALERAGLAGHKDALIGKLSGGERQRVMIARLLLSAPQLLILDEPLTGIDSAAAKQIFETLKGLIDGGTTVFMISHDTAYTENIFDKVYCLAYGSLVELDKKQIELERQSRHTHPHKGI